ncbi:M23 family metallopeptidase [Devosia sp.]|uniref:M23 family metallopeptidase n=1 Tax=Devosia sp. TaxID=1871048 RepID=UPI0025BC8CE5|nr:M23 family metallopeptidase [Devosia sp.]
MLAGLVVVNAVTLSGLVTHPDVSRMWDGQQTATSAYEARLAQLRRDVDRLRSRETASSGSTALKVQDLTQLQLQLAEQLSTVRLLGSKVADLGIAVFQKPLPSIRRDNETSPKVGPIDRIELELRDMEQETVTALGALTEIVTLSAEAITEELTQLGHPPQFDARLGVGGPLLEAADMAPVVPTFDLGPALAAIDRLTTVRLAMERTPVHPPVATSRVSSGYGLRSDPFTGQKAFHSGIDFPAPTGTPVSSAASGVVSFVGWKDGYGRVVEITHASGLVSRYPHLSKALVAEGDEVEADARIALVGSTGRSTGPHLHFELRQGDNAIDPAPFLKAGKRLEAFDT